MAAGLLVALLLAFACENVVSQSTEHVILWDRFWLANNLTNNTLNVRLNDAVMFICQVENSEAPEDRIENIVLLSEEKHLVECDIGPEGDSNNLVVCSNSLIDHFLQITDSLELNNRLNFPAGQAYYFTSFSDGTLESANNDVSKGGACNAAPPLRLTISVSATPSSFPLSTTTITNPTTTSSTRDIISTSSVVTTSSSQVAQPTSTVIRQPTPPSITDPEALSGAGLLSPVHYVILLLSLFITCILTL